MIRGLMIVLLCWPLMAAAQGVLQIERDLAAIGYNPGAIDGVQDAQTTRAIQSFQYGNGADASGQLSVQQQRYLRQIAQLASATTAFIFDGGNSQVGIDTRNLGTRTLYANGADFLMRWRFGGFNSKNSSLGELSRVLSTAHAERFRYLRKRAQEIAEASRDPISMAVAHVARHEEAENEHADTLNAYQLLIAKAEAQPGETAYLKTLHRLVTSHLVTYRLCEGPKGADFHSLMQRTVDLFLRTNPEPQFASRMLGYARGCLPQAQHDQVFQLQLDLARRTSDKAILDVLSQWARDAAARGRDALARDKLRFVADHYAAQTPRRTNVNQVVDEGLIPAALVTLMHQVGMHIEARKFGAQRIERFEQTHPSQVREESRAQMGGFDNAQLNSARMFIWTRQFDHFYRLGVYRRQHQGLKGPNAADWEPADTGPWFLAVDAMEKIWSDDALSQQTELAQIILPPMLSAGAFGPALKLSLIQAKAAEELGQFQEAEEALVRIVSIAQTAGLTESVQSEVEALRRKLNLSRLADLSPAERLLGQMDIYYGAACGSLETAQRAAWEFPDFDYEAIGNDPSVAKALIDTDAMNKLLGCFFPQRLKKYEIRFMCAVAGISGRRDVAEYLLRGTGGDNAQYQLKAYSEQCIFGLTHVGRLDWVRRDLLPEADSYESDVFAFLGLSPVARQQVAAQADMEDVEWSRLDRIFGLQYLEKDIPQFQRKRLAERFHTSFAGGFGNMGPSVQDEAEVLDNGIALHQAGLFRAAEIHYSNDQRVDPFAFGQEDLSTLNDDLTVPAHITLRLLYARLYRDQGAMDRAYGAIGPLAEQAIARLGSEVDPLPGTIEQWAKRFEPLFAAYLELQFEGLSKDPNYPAMFAIQQYLQLANSTASASVLEQRLNSASPDLARQYQDARRALRRAIDTSEQGDTKVAELSLQLQALEARLPQSDAALQSHQIGVTRPLHDVVLELRGAGAAMVVATQLPDTLVLMYLDGKGASARKLDLGREASAAQVTAFRAGVLNSDDTRDLFDPLQAASLYQALIGWGHVGKAPPDALRLVMEGPFSTLPFAALRRPDGWLGAQASLRLSPSVARAASGLRQGETFRGFVGLGDPNLTEGDVSARTALLGAGLHLPELPETANELTFMALSFGGNPSRDVFTRDAASEAQLLALNADNRLADVSILALATHGLLSRETGALNAAGLVLSLPQAPDTDGILTATEIYNYRIGADLVVLSACNTGTPGAGEGLSDLASAFLYSGAGALLLTHWEIDSGAGVEIMKRIAIDQRTDAAGDYAASLQKALGSMLADDGLDKYHHPRFWASHFILG